MMLFEGLVRDGEKEDGMRVMKEGGLGMRGEKKVWVGGKVMMGGVVEKEVDLVKEGGDRIVWEIVGGGKEGMKEEGWLEEEGGEGELGN